MKFPKCEFDETINRILYVWKTGRFVDERRWNRFTVLRNKLKDPRKVLCCMYGTNLFELYPQQPSRGRP
jgi:hypothetical protein